MTRAICPVCSRPAWAVIHTQFAGTWAFCHRHYQEEVGVSSVLIQDGQEESWELLTPLSRREQVTWWLKETWKAWEVSTIIAAYGITVASWMYWMASRGQSYWASIGAFVAGAIAGKLIWDWRKRGQ